MFTVEHLTCDAAAATTVATLKRLRLRACSVRPLSETSCQIVLPNNRQSLTLWVRVEDAGLKAFLYRFVNGKIITYSVYGSLVSSCRREPVLTLAAAAV